jgi:hypothetical protein
MRPWLLLLAACGGTRYSIGGQRGPAAGDSAEEQSCPADECGGACVDLLSDPYNCGSCGRTCVLAEGAAACVEGECAIGECEEGLLDCDGLPDNGCETTDTCSAGAACTTTCGSTGAMDCAEPCLPACTIPAESCNAIDDNCDGSCDEGLSCRTDVYRSHGPYGHMYGLDPAEATALGQSIEADPFFYVYTAPGGSLTALYRCDKGGGTSFLTTSSTCEIGLTVNLVVGYVATSEVCGAIPLYRLYHSSSGNHFYTTNSAEAESAVYNYGYTSEGVAAWVWSSP